MKSLVIPLCLGLSGCAMISSPGDQAEHKVLVSGETYLLRQITASTWIATATSASKPLANTASATAALRDAVEKTSGCKVTDSDYSREGRQFDAQIDCGGLSR